MHLQPYPEIIEPVDLPFSLQFPIQTNETFKCRGFAIPALEDSHLASVSVWKGPERALHKRKQSTCAYLCIPVSLLWTEISQLSKPYCFTGKFSLLLRWYFMGPVFPHTFREGALQNLHTRGRGVQKLFGGLSVPCAWFSFQKSADTHNTPPLVSAGAISWHFSVLPWGFLCTTWRRSRCTENSAAPLLGLCIVFQVLPSSKEISVFFQRFGHLACSVAASWLLCTAALAWLTTQGSKQSTSSLLTPWQHPAPQTAKDGAEAGRTLIPLGCTQLQPEEGVGATTTGGFQMTAPRASHRRPWDTESEHLEISKCTAYIYSGCKGLCPKGHSLFCSIIMRGE